MFIAARVGQALSPATELNSAMLARTCEISELIAIESHLTVRVLNLETLIELKEQAGREEDRAVLSAREKAKANTIPD